MRLKEFTKQYLPREKLEKFGVENLSDVELLAIILNTGTKQENVLELASRLVRKNKLFGLMDYSLYELCSFAGIGKAKASKILSVFELCKRLKSEKTDKNNIRSAKNIFNLMSYISYEKQEHLVVVFLDSKNNVIGKKVVFKGTINETIIHPREIFREAIKHSSNSIIIVHNHPSGDPSPSDEDKKVTLKIKDASLIMGIYLLDHVIIGQKTYFSFKDQGLI